MQRPCSPRVSLVVRGDIINTCIMPSGDKFQEVKQSRARRVLIEGEGRSRKESLIRWHLMFEPRPYGSKGDSLED